MIGSKAGVTDRTMDPKGAGDAAVFVLLGLSDRCRDNALPDTADVESGSGVARQLMVTGGMSNERDGGNEVGPQEIASGSVSVASSTRSIAQPP